MCVLFGGSCDDVEVLEPGEAYDVDVLSFSKMPEEPHGVGGVLVRQVADFWLQLIMPPHPKLLPELFFNGVMLRFHLEKQVRGLPDLDLTGPT